VGAHVQVEAMKAVANSHSKRSLQQFEEALVKYTPQVRAT
jgi:ribosomal protein S7